MPYSFGNLRAELRPEIWPTGEAASLVTAHNRMFLDALLDLQQWVDCLQYDNTTLFPQCSTFYNCGLTVFPAPRGAILKVSVIDKINPTTRKEDATSPDDWCSEIDYRQISFCHMQSFLHRAVRSRGCCSVPLFFGLSSGKGHFPTPSDAGLAGLPTLPLGYHYGQVSTDSTRGRSTQGVWAIERGKIFIAPWLQSTETAVVKWDGLKRAWTDGDLVDNDPLLKTAVSEYVRWKHAAIYDKDEAEAARANAAYNVALQNMIHACREETRTRGCEPSRARASGFSTDTSTTPLFFNEQQQATATCPDGQTGSEVTVTIPANTVSSTASVADANQKAQNEAQSQANAQLSCQASPVTFTNDAQSFTAQCQTSEVGAPAPDGNPVTITIPAGTVTSSVSKDDANAQALLQAQTQATAQLQCTFWNAAQTYNATCPLGSTGAPVTVTIPAHTVSSSISQDDADAKALNQAKTSAQTQLNCTGGGLGVFTNTSVSANYSLTCPTRFIGSQVCIVTVFVTVPPGVFSSVISQNDANSAAFNAGRALAQQTALQNCALRQCGTFNITYQ